MIIDGHHVPYTLQTMITCDHMSRDMFPVKHSSFNQLSYSV